MPTRLRISIWILVGGLVFPSLDAAWAQVPAERLEAIRGKMDQLNSLFQRFPAEKRKALSGGAQNLLHLAETWRQRERSLAQAPATRGAPRTPRPTGLTVQISDPSTDFSLSRLGGFTQSETSGAWCGNNVVVGFNDSGSFLQTLPVPGIGLSFNGFSLSPDRGHTYTDMGFLPPGPTTTDFLSGDPVLGCTDANTFYYASLLERLSTSAISVSKATGGSTFGNPIPAIEKNAMTHFLDKEWMAVDPTNPMRIFLTYTDFDDSFTSPACGATSRTAIESTRSTDGGMTWSPPVVIQEVCGAPFVQGSQVLVGPDGAVSVAWEFFGADFVTRALRIRKSTDHGVTFSPPVTVSDVGPVGGTGCAVLQGNIRDFEFPSLAVRRSDNTLFIAWNDGRNHNVPDEDCGSYAFSDVFVKFSADGGATWSPAIQVNDNPVGTDSFQPVIGVDQTNGMVGVCWYDRRNDPLNFRIDRFCAATGIPGNLQVTPANFPVVVGQDSLIASTYQGDYDTLPTDFTGMNSGFLVVWGDNSRGNPDVLGLTTAP